MTQIKDTQALSRANQNHLNYAIHSAMLSPGVCGFVQAQQEDAPKIHLFPPGLCAEQALLQSKLVTDILYVHIKST